MLDELKTFLDDHQIYHSKLQMDCFITASSGGTPYGQYKQALRELLLRWGALGSKVSEKRLVEIDIAELESGVLDTEDFFETERQNVRLTQLRAKLLDAEAHIADQVREFAHFYSQAKALKEVVGELTPERRDQLDLEFWEHKCKETAAMDIMGTGRPSQAFFRSIQYLPVEMRTRIIESCKKPKELIEWFTTLDYRHDHAPDALPEEDIYEALELEA